MLRFIDTRWMAHLQEMDYLKASIGLRAYGQRDPLTEYRDEAHRAFAALTSSQEESSPLDGKVSYSNPEQTLNEGSGVRRGAPQGGPSPAPAAPKPEAHKPQTYEKDKNDPYANVGRNDPCPCGSGKKYKKCHGANH